MMAFASLSPPVWRASTVVFPSLEAFVNRKARLTMMCVTHEMGFAQKVGHRVVFMDEGKIVDDLPVADFFAKDAAKSGRASAFLSQLTY